MLDAVYFEELGIPAAAILTEPFRGTGVAIAELRGFTDYPFAVAPHPITSLDDNQVTEVADAITPEVERLLLGQVAASADKAGVSLEDLVETLAVGLRSDGADLTATESGEEIVFQLHIPTQACAECVMPAATLRSIFQKAVDDQFGPGRIATVNDPRV